MRCASDREDCMAMDIKIRLEMHNLIMWYLEFHTRVVEWYCVRNRMILLSAPLRVAPGFVEYVALLRLAN